MARFFVALTGVAFCLLWGVLPIAARPSTEDLSDGSRSDSVLTLSTAPTPPSQESPEGDSFYDAWSYDIHNETDEWDAALDSQSPDTILANDRAAAASPDMVAYAGGRRFRRRSVSRVRRTLSWDNACSGEESVDPGDSYYPEEEVDQEEAGTESNRITELNGTLHALRHSLFADVKNRYTHCSRRRRLSTGGRLFPPTERNTSAHNDTEQQEDVMCQLNNRLKQVAYLTKIVNDSETDYLRTVVRRWTILDELKKLAGNSENGIYPNLCKIQTDIAQRGRTCPPSNVPGDSPGGGSSANSRQSRDDRIASNCNRLREIETLLNDCAELIRNAAAQQVQGMTSS